MDSRIRLTSSFQEQTSACRIHPRRSRVLDHTKTLSHRGLGFFMRLRVLARLTSRALLKDGNILVIVNPARIVERQIEFLLPFAFYVRASVERQPVEIR